jgi:hypothetical protein
VSVQDEEIQQLRAEKARLKCLPKTPKLLVAPLENEGVKRIFGIPGEKKSGRGEITAFVADRTGT